MLAGIVAFLGILSALLAIELERARELSVLRTLGFTPGGLGATLLTQTGLLGLAAGLAAVPIGTALALLLVHVINRPLVRLDDGFRADAASVGVGRVAGRRRGVARRDLSGVARRAESSSARRCGRIDAAARMALAGARAARGVQRRRRSERVRRRSNTGLRLLGGEAGDGFARATEPRDVRVSGRSRQPSRVSNRVVVFHRQPGDDERPSLRLRADVLPLRARACDAARARAHRPGAPSRYGWRTSRSRTREGGRFIARERLTREALGLAGAEPEPLRDLGQGLGGDRRGRDDELTLRLDARDDAIALALDLASTVPHVAQGDRGLDAKGAGAGNASHYYSVPRLAADGHAHGRRRDVRRRRASHGSIANGARARSSPARWAGTGLRCICRTAAALMFYRLRTRARRREPVQRRQPRRRRRRRRSRLRRATSTLTALDHWTSATTGVRYPVAWRLAAPTAGITLDVRPYLENQEVDLVGALLGRRGSRRRARARRRR